ncbi:MAG: UDP-2,3-diacylglucosamine diphosphatase LpxI [Paracoccaceae bacterium]|jgi:DUF1009 family protein
MGANGNITDAALGIICGRGDLPQLLAKACRDAGRAYYVVKFENIPLGWTTEHPVISAVFEQTGSLLDNLKQRNCTQVVMAGAMVRSHLDPDRLDDRGRELALILAETMQAGDDKTLSSIIQFFEGNGITVTAAHEVLPSLIPEVGVLTNVAPNIDDTSDANRAAEIVNSLGRLDVGQGAVVAQGICLGLESIQGTDTMLDFVASHRAGYSHNPDGGRGVLLKAPKPQQDLRVDLPTIGPDSVRRAHKAGLSGIVIQSGGVMVLHEEETITVANELGLFLWVRPKG